MDTQQNFSGNCFFFFLGDWCEMLIARSQGFKGSEAAFKPDQSVKLTMTAVIDFCVVRAK